jgi:glyoxylase-like metal-dependent hydrolase (beta-lactamase superfamily II)
MASPQEIWKGGMCILINAGPDVTTFHNHVISRLKAYLSRSYPIRQLQYTMRSSPYEEPEPTLHSVFESTTQTWQYIIADPTSNDAVVIDPVMTHIPDKKSIATTAADALLDIIREHDYKIVRILETYSYADWPSAAWYMRAQLLQKSGYAPRVAAKKSLNILQRMHRRKYTLANRQWEAEFDGPFEDGDDFLVGALTVRVMWLPTRSRHHVGYLVGGLLFTGDCVFHSEQSCVSDEGRDEIQASIERVLDLPRVTVYTTSMCRERAVEPTDDGEINEKATMACQNVTASVAVGLDDGMVS